MITTKYIIYTFLLLLITSSGKAQESSEALFSNSSHYFGTFSKSKGKQSHRFELTNTTNKPLVIKRVKSSCGCAATEYTRQLITPGEKGYVKVVFDPAKFSGYFSKKISVYTSASNQAIQLSISGRIRVNSRVNDTFTHHLGDLRVEKKVIDFGDTEKKSEVNKDLKMINIMRDPIKLRIVNYPDWLSSCKITKAELKQGDNSRILVTVTPQDLAQWGSLTGSITMEITRGVKTEQKQVPVQINLIDAFSTLSSEQLKSQPVISCQSDTLLMAHKPGKVISSKLTIINQGNSPLYIRRVQSNSEHVHIKKFDAVIEPSKKGQVNIQYSCGSSITEQPQVYIWSNDKQHYKKEIQLQIENK